MSHAKKTSWLRQCIQMLLVFAVTVWFLLLIFLDANAARKSTGTMRIISNGIEQCAYLNCSHSSQCTTDNVSCCASVLKNALLFIDTFFELHNLSYVVIYGTLLGAVRNNTIIPWTRDIDVAFFNRTLLFTEEIRQELHRHGYHIFETLKLTRLCVHRNATNASLLATHDVHHKRPASIYDLHAYVDLYYAEKLQDPSNRRNVSNYVIEFSDSLKSPISFSKDVTIDEQRFPTVDNIEEHLVRFYGLQYMQDIVPLIP